MNQLISIVVFYLGFGVIVAIIVWGMITWENWRIGREIDKHRTPVPPTVTESVGKAEVQGPGH